MHAGEGEEAGAPAWTIWSHSWYANSRAGTVGPDFNKLGGLQVGDSKYWVGKYTIQPENGGLGVFAHEYGHDLGLPDLYDYDGENGTGFWTLMSVRLLAGRGQGHDRQQAAHMGAWEKFQLGWLKYEVATRRRELVAQARADGVQHQAGPGRVRDPAQEDRDRADRHSLRRQQASTTAARVTT